MKEQNLVQILQAPEQQLKVINGREDISLTTVSLVTQANALVYIYLVILPVRLKNRLELHVVKCTYMKTTKLVCSHWYSSMAIGTGTKGVGTVKSIGSLVNLTDFSGKSSSEKEQKEHKKENK